MIGLRITKTKNQREVIRMDEINKMVKYGTAKDGVNFCEGMERLVELAREEAQEIRNEISRTPTIRQ